MIVDPDSCALADTVYLIALWLVLYRVFVKKNAKGISILTQGLLAICCSLRVMALPFALVKGGLASFGISELDPIFLLGHGVIVYYALHMDPIKSTKSLDSIPMMELHLKPLFVGFGVAFIVIPAVVFGIGPGYIAILSKCMEPFCLIPQIVMYKNLWGQATNCGYFLFLMGIYRLLCEPYFFDISYEVLYSFFSWIQAFVCFVGLLAGAAHNSRQLVSWTFRYCFDSRRGTETCLLFVFVLIAVSLVPTNQLAQAVQGNGVQYRPASSITYGQGGTNQHTHTYAKPDWHVVEPHGAGDYVSPFVGLLTLLAVTIVAFVHFRHFVMRPPTARRRSWAATDGGGGNVLMVENSLDMATDDVAVDPLENTTKKCLAVQKEIVEVDDKNDEPDTFLTSKQMLMLGAWFSCSYIIIAVFVVSQDAFDWRLQIMFLILMGVTPAALLLTTRRRRTVSSFVNANTTKHQENPNRTTTPWFSLQTIDTARTRVPSDVDNNDDHLILESEEVDDNSNDPLLESVRSVFVSFPCFCTVLIFVFLLVTIYSILDIVSLTRYDLYAGDFGFIVGIVFSPLTFVGYYHWSVRRRDSRPSYRRVHDGSLFRWLFDEAAANNRDEKMVPLLDEMFEGLHQEPRYVNGIMIV